MKLSGQFHDSQKVKIKTPYEEKIVPYSEVRLGIHDVKIEDSVCKEALLRMGSHREASVYEIIEERKKAKKSKKAKEKLAEKKEPKESIKV